MRRFSLILGLLVLGLALTTSAALAAPGTVAGTFTLADNGQGGWTGGALLAGGAATGGGAFSENDVRYQFQATSWQFVAGTNQQVVDICFVVVSSAGGPPVGATFCVSDFAPPGVPVTGTPLKVSPFGDETTIIQVRLNH